MERFPTLHCLPYCLPFHCLPLSVLDPSEGMALVGLLGGFGMGSIAVYLFCKKKFHFKEIKTWGPLVSCLLLLAVFLYQIFPKIGPFDPNEGGMFPAYYSGIRQGVFLAFFLLTFFCYQKWIFRTWIRSSLFAILSALLVFPYIFLLFIPGATFLAAPLNFLMAVWPVFYPVTSWAIRRFWQKQNGGKVSVSSLFVHTLIWFFTSNTILIYSLRFFAPQGNH